MKTYWFKCPDCGCIVVEEIKVDVITTTEITLADPEDDGPILNYEEINSCDGYVDRYQCQRCGMVINDEEGYVITDEEKLLETIYYNKTKFSSE